MISTDKLTRIGETESVFTIVVHSHWSEIVNVNDPNDCDYVKWLGADEYISANRGFKYRVLPRNSP